MKHPQKQIPFGAVIAALLLLVLPSKVQAQYDVSPNWTSGAWTWTIARYTGIGGAVTIPSTFPDYPYPVARIGEGAFSSSTSPTSITMPNSITSIGDSAFALCSSLTNITMPNSITRIGGGAFHNCSSLTNITMPNSLTSIGDMAFYYCTSLKGVYFQGNAPSLGGSNVFNGANNTTVYYLSGTTGWGPSFGGRPTALWSLPNPLILSSGPNFGVQTNAFGFIILWATNVPGVVEACTNLTNPIWSPLQTNNLTNGSSYFSDPQWTNYPKRFYRLRSQ